MEDISIFGLKARLTASVTFPSGIDISQFADDGDPLESPDLEIASMAMGPNGDTITWSRPELIGVGFTVIPQGEDAVNMTALVDANRVSKGKTSARDTITMVWTYPNGMVVTCSDGKVTTGPVIQSGTSAGRAKSQRFEVRFGKVQRTAAPVVAS